MTSHRSRNSICINLGIIAIGTLGFLTSCFKTEVASPRVPSQDYAMELRKRGQSVSSNQAVVGSAGMHGDSMRARLQLVSESAAAATLGDAPESQTKEKSDKTETEHALSNLEEVPAPTLGEQHPYVKVESSQKYTRDYNGPLSLGDPGMSASLWRESRGGNDIFRDHRAFYPMDLITIVVAETSEGKKEADTEMKQSSSISAAITKLFGLEKKAPFGLSTELDPAALLAASTASDFKGEGATNRKDSLSAKMSAMVVEVLPTGILRIEGERIISVNSEEQTMVISGLVRPKDISSNNEVSSSQIAQMRIDYYGSGTVDDVQHGGWMGNIVRRYWPF